jgi:predicted DNA-binding protein
MPIPSNNYKPFLTYLDPREYTKLKKFAAKTKTPMTQIVREAVKARIADNNAYVNGFNDGLKEAIDAVNAMKHAQMRFPSGKSFAELVTDDLIVRRMKEGKNETDGSKEPVPGV